MADRIDDLISQKPFDQIDRLIKQLVELEGKISDINKTNISIAGDARGSGSLADLAENQKKAAAAANQLVGAMGRYNEVEEEAINLISRHNGHSKEVADVMIKLMQLKREEAKATRDGTAATRANNEEKDRESAARKQEIVDKKAAAQQDREAKKALADYIKSVKEGQKELERYAKEQEKLAKSAERRAANETAKAAARQEAEAARVAREELKKFNDEVVRSQKETEKQIAEVERMKNAYYALNVTHKALYAEAQRLGAEFGIESKEFTEAAARANDLESQLRAIDTALGNHRRNVGNYTSAWNGLGSSIQQLAREIPNFASDIRTGFLAISNNLPILGDELARVRMENAALTAQGQPTVSVFRQIASSIFSWQTALIVLITLLVAYGDKLFASNKATKEAEKANKKYADSLNSIEESARNSAQQDIARIEILAKLAADEAQSHRTRMRAIKELQETYPATFGALTKQALLEGQLGDAVKQTTKALLDRAAAQAAEKKFAAAREKEYDERLLRDDALGKAAAIKKTEEDLADARNRQYSKDKKEREDAYADVRRLMATRARFLKEYGVGTLSELDKLAVDAEQRRLSADKESQRFLTDAQKSAAAAGDVLFGKDPKEKKGPKEKKPTDFTNEILKSEQDFTRELYNELKIRSENEAEAQQAIYENDTNTLERRLTAYDEYSRRRIEAAGFAMSGEYEATEQALDKIAQIEGKAADKRTNEEKNLLLQKETLQQKQTNLVSRFELEQSKIVNDQAKYRKDLQEKYADEAEKATTEALRNLNSIRNGGPSETRADHDKAEQALNDQYISAIKNVAGVAHNLSERKLNDIDKELEAIEKRKNAEINSIEKSTLSEEEKQKRIALAEAKATQQSESLAAKRRKIAERQYQVDKAINIASIIQETSLAVIRALNDKTVPYPVRIGYAIGAGITGAAQLALALSAPPPQFFKGTESSPEGPAWVGERGTEMYVTPDGKIGLTPDSATLTYLQAGTQIIDHKKTVEILDYVGLGLSGLRTPENTGNKELSEGMDKMADKIVSAIKSKKDVTLTGHPDWWKDYSYKRGKS